MQDLYYGKPDASPHHHSPTATEVSSFLPGEAWQFDDDDYGVRCGFTNARYARPFVDDSSGYIAPMYAKTLTAKELRKHIDELVQFVATARNGRRVRLLTCDKFPSYVDKQFVEDIRATHGIEMIAIW